MYESFFEVDIKRELVRVFVGFVNREVSDDSNNEREQKIKFVDVGNSLEEYSDVESFESKEVLFVIVEGEEYIVSIMVQWMKNVVTEVVLKEKRRILSLLKQKIVQKNKAIQNILLVKKYYFQLLKEKRIL